MKEYIKKFPSATAADQYAISTIPFITSVATNPIQNLVCNESGKKLVSVGEIIEIQSAGPASNEIHYTATEQITPNDATVFGATYLSEESTFDRATDEGVLKFDGDVTGIGEGAFYECTSLTSITIPNSVTSIEGPGAFQGCTGLTSVTIPDSVTSIGDAAFMYCSALTSIEIPNSVTSIGEGAFGGCESLTSIEIPNSVTSIGGGAFQGCTGLTSVTIPDSVTSIGEEAFNNCTSLTSIEIPNSVTSIGESAFGGCEGLISVTCKALTPPTCGDWAFNATNDCPIYVPAQSVDAYKAAQNWSTYASRIYASGGLSD